MKKILYKLIFFIAFIVFAVSFLRSGFFSNNQVDNDTYLIQTETSSLCGFYVSSDAENEYIATCYHGLADASSIIIDNKEAALVSYDIYSDIAIVSVENTSDSFGYACASPKKEEVTITGYSNGNEETVTANIIDNNYSIENSIVVDGKQYDYEEKVLCIDTVLENGFSGSPILNKEGRVVGMITMADEQVTYGISIDTINDFVDLVIEND